ncbi:MAG: hypothetical protein ACE5G9_02810 [Nitrospinales bacterium]
MSPSSERPLPLGEFLPADRWQTHVNCLFYGMLGSGIHRHFQTYVSRDHRLAYCLADEFLEQCPAGDSTCFIQEWGVGNGNLAACFLDRLKAGDPEGRVYPRVHYLLCDYSRAILTAACSRLQAHAGRFSAVLMDAEGPACFKPRSIHKILSNEIWDDLAAKVLWKDDGLLYEEYLCPTLPPRPDGMDFESFKHFFAEKNPDGLADAPLDQIVWERVWQRVDTSDWPFSRLVEAHSEKLAERVAVPVNLGALACLQRAWELLAPDGLGYSGLDYGMLSFDDLNQQGRPWFNIYGGQYTAMVNFPLLAEVGRKIGFRPVSLEHQHRYVSRRLGEKVAGAVELVQSHPRIERMAPWDRDILMLGTLHALNGVYQSPYDHKMEYPPSPGTPKKQRKTIRRLAETLSRRGVPDTVAYVTEGEVFAVVKSLLKLGYRENDLRRAFDLFRGPVSFVHAGFRK